MISPTSSPTTEQLRRIPERRRFWVARRATAAGIIAIGLLGSQTIAAPAGADEPTTTVPQPTVPVPVPVPTPPPPALPAQTSLAAAGQVLHVGSTGIDVAFMQFKLVQRGFWLQDPIGRFGDSTLHGLVSFQKFYGLPRSGKLDPVSRWVLASFSNRATVRGPGPGHRIEIDLGRQVMIISTNNVVDFVFDISSGKRSTPTPRGDFRLTRQILGVRRSALGILYSPKYFTGGYAIHGSKSVPTQAASHGCIRVTNQTINYLWGSNLIPLGTAISLA